MTVRAKHVLFPCISYSIRSTFSIFFKLLQAKRTNQQETNNLLNVIVGVRQDQVSESVFHEVAAFLHIYERTHNEECLTDALTAASRISKKKIYNGSGLYTLLQRLYFNEGLFPLASCVVKYIEYDGPVVAWRSGE